MLTYTVKQDGSGFAPVGEEMLVGKMEENLRQCYFYAIMMVMQKLNQNHCKGKGH